MFNAATRRSLIAIFVSLILMLLVPKLRTRTAPGHAPDAKCAVGLFLPSVKTEIRARQVAMLGHVAPYRFQPGNAIGVAGLPRTGSTLVYNAVRLLVHEVDPNVVGAFESSTVRVAHWKAINVSMVVKMHVVGMRLPYFNSRWRAVQSDVVAITNALDDETNKSPGAEAVQTPHVLNETDVFDAILFNHRDPSAMLCSLCRFWGTDTCLGNSNFTEDQRIDAMRRHCADYRDLQADLYMHLASRAVYDFSFEDELSVSRPIPRHQLSSDEIARLVNTVARLREVLGLGDRVDDTAVVRLAETLSRLRDVSADDGHHPNTLLHVRMTVGTE
jgi:hypothetical protein